MVMSDYKYYKHASLEVLNKEREGYKWFGIDTQIIKHDTIMIPFFKGKTFTQYNGITGNEEWIKTLIIFYKYKWTKDKFCVHGDLALCNVIFGDKVYIIDWEHFHKSSPEFWGFDIINMLFIHLQYEYRWLTYWGFNWIPFIKKRHKDFIRECCDLLGNRWFMNKPFSNGRFYIQRYMDSDKFILGKQSDDVLRSLDVIRHL